MPTGVKYFDMCEAIADYYGTGSDVWLKWVTNAPMDEKLIRDLTYVPGVEITVTPSGKYVGYDYKYPFPEKETPFSSGDSNIPNKTYGSNSFNARVNGNYTWDGTLQKGSFTSGAKRAGTTVKTVASKLNVATTAVAAGMFLGAKIDSALYNVGKFFDLNPPEELNPETWDDMASSELGKSVIRHLFDIGDDGETTAYMPEEMIEYMYQYWNELGVFSEPGITNNVDPDVKSTITHPNSYPDSFPIATQTLTVYADNTSDEYKFTSGSGYFTVYVNTEGTINTVAVASEPNSTFTRTWPPGVSTYTLPNIGSVLSLGKYGTTIAASQPPAWRALGSTNATDIGKLILTGTHVISGGGPEGTSLDPNATPSGTIDLTQPILPQLKQNMPQVFNNPITESIPQPDGTTKDMTYYPVPWPKVTDDTEKPVSGTPTQATPTITPQTPTDEQDKIKDVITNMNPQPTTPTPGDPATPPDTGSGSSPTVVMPTGQGSSLWTVYNPTQGQLDAFGSWLWSSNFVEQIKKLFNDPMQAIIGVHKVYATPSTGGQVNIKCGYIDSGCPAAEVTSQYTTVDCGSVSLREYFGNVLDYPPYTEVSLYLPFIGIVKLDPADVLRSTIHVIYHVDVITGACLADVKVSRDGENAILYQYSGSAICSYPLSSGSYAGVVTGVLSMAAGIAGTVLSGGAAAPALIGGAMGLTHLHTDVQKSGSFSGSAGAMGGKVPYVILSRAQDATPANFEQHEGKPASKTVTLGNCEGFVKVKSINIDDVPATYGELDQIVSLLKTGVIL